MVMVLFEVERVKMVVACRSVGTIVRLECFQRDLIIQKSPEAIEGGLNVFVGVKANISCLEGPGCWSSTTMKDAGCDDAGADLCGC